MSVDDSSFHYAGAGAILDQVELVHGFMQCGGLWFLQEQLGKLSPDIPRLGSILRVNNACHVVPSVIIAMTTCMWAGTQGMSTALSGAEELGGGGGGA